MTHEYTLLIGGTVITGRDEPDATAIAWAADTVIALGSDDEVRGRRAATRTSSTSEARVSWRWATARTPAGRPTRRSRSAGPPIWRCWTPTHVNWALQPGGRLRLSLVVRAGRVVAGGLPGHHDP